MRRVIGVILRAALRLSLTVLILGLVLAPALWLGRDLFAPGLAQWIANRQLESPAIERLSFRIDRLAPTGLVLADVSLNGPEGPRARRIAIDYAWRELVTEGRLEAVRVDGARLEVTVDGDGRLGLPGLDPLLAALPVDASGAASDTALPPITVTGSALSLTGAVRGLVPVAASLSGSTRTLAAAIEATPDLASAAWGGEMAADLLIELRRASSGLAVETRIAGLRGGWGDGAVVLPADGAGTASLRLPEDGAPTIAATLWAPALRLGDREIVGPWMDLRQDAGALTLRATGRPRGVSEGERAPPLDLALALDPESPGPAGPRRTFQLRATAPLRPAVALTAGLVSLGSDAGLSIGLTGGLPWPPPSPEALWPDLVASGSVGLTGAADAGTPSGRLAATLAAGRLLLETVEPVVLPLDPAALASRIGLRDDPDEPVSEGLFGHSPRLVLGEATPLSLSLDDPFGAPEMALRGPLVLSGDGSEAARVACLVDLVAGLDPEAVSGPDAGSTLSGLGIVLRRPAKIDLSASGLTWDGATLSELDARIDTRVDAGGLSVDYALDLAANDPARGVHDAAAALSGALRMEPERQALYIVDGRVAARRLAVLAALRPIEGLLARIAAAPDAPVLERRRDPQSGRWTNRLAVSLRPEPLRLVSAEGAPGPALIVDPGTVALTGELDMAGTGTARARMVGGGASLDGQGIEATGLAADLRLALTTGTPRLEGIALSARRVVDRASALTRFVPLSLEATARPAPTDRAPHRLRFDATLRGVDGAFVIDAAGRHDPDAGRGRAEILLHPVSFTPGGLQPGDISPAAAAIFGETTGSVAADGGIRWPGERGRLEESPFTLRLSDLSFSGSLGAVLGLDGAVTLSAIDPPATPDGQILQAALIDPGLPIDSPQVRFRLPGDGALLLERIDAEFAGGSVRAEELRIPLAGNDPVSLRLQVEQVDAGRLADLIRLDGLDATGALSGSIPLVWDPSRGLSIAEAQLVADGTGGVVRYRPEPVPDALQGAGREVSLMLEALRNLVYERFSVSADGRPGEAFEVKLNIHGSNPDLYDGHPVDLNVSVSGRLDELFRDVRRVLSIPDAVRGRLQDGVEAPGG